MQFGRDFDSNEGVQIFTVKRESGSSLMSQTKPVCKRSGRIRIARAVALLVLSALSLSSGYGQLTPLPRGDLFSTGAQATPQMLCEPQVIGNRRIPKESVLARLFSRAGDPYDPLTVERDFNSLWNTEYFENVQIEKVETPKCVQLVIYVKEKPTIREIDYKGVNAVSQSDILDRFKKVKVGLSVESQYDPTKIKQAEVALR